MNIGSSNRIGLDNCAYQKNLMESTSPLQNRMYLGQFENCNKCMYDKFYRKFDLTDVESELLNITRPLSKCDQFKYNPNCSKESGMCLSTFDSSIPVVLAPEVCPIVYNNIPRQTGPGYVLEDPSNFCAQKNYKTVKKRCRQ